MRSDVRIEDARFPAWIVPDTTDVLPVAPVGVHVVVDEHHLVVLRAVAPVDVKVLGEEAGDVLARAVGVVARVVEFALGGVDEAHAGRG